MAESGIDLTFDDQTTYDSTGNTSDASSSSMMAHLQTLSTSSGNMASSGSVGMRGRKPALRSLQRQALAKQQAEQQQQLRQKSTLDTHKSASSSYARALTTVGPLQSYNESFGVSGLADSHAVGSTHDSIGDVSGRTAPAAFSLLSVHSASQLWPNSAPEMITIEPLNPTGSNPVSFAEYDEQLNDIVSSIENDICGTSQSSTSYLSASSLPDGSYRGGRKKEPPPPNMTPDQRVLWEQERDKKDKHNNIEKRRRYKINDCIQELGSMLPESYNSIYREQMNSKGAILEATVEYIHSLHKDKQKVGQLAARVEQLEAQQRKLLLQRETLRAALLASQSTSKSPTAPAVVPQADMNLSPSTELHHPSSQSSPPPLQLISRDCYMVVANDNNDAGDSSSGAVLDLDSFVLDDDVMMITDDHEVIVDDGQLLI